MKKSFVLIAVIVATLAYSGLVFAQGCGLPPVCGHLYVAKSKPWHGKWIAPKGVPILPPRCFKPKCCCGVIHVPGSPYAVGPKLVNLPFTRTVNVMRNLCVGKAKGVCRLCGPCAPTVAWSGSWKTAEIVGKTKITVMLPPAYQWCGAAACPKGPIGLKCIPKPCPAPECCF
jgi:hypothetical protein